MTNPNIETDFNKLDKRIDKLENNLTAKIESVKNDLTTEIKLIKNDLTWIKWLFGIFSSLIIVLLGTMLTVLFKLLNSI